MSKNVLPGQKIHTWFGAAVVLAVDSLEFTSSLDPNDRACFNKVRVGGDGFGPVDFVACEIFAANKPEYKHLYVGNKVRTDAGDFEVRNIFFNPERAHMVEPTKVLLRRGPMMLWKPVDQVRAIRSITEDEPDAYGQKRDICVNVNVNPKKVFGDIIDDSIREAAERVGLPYEVAREAIRNLSPLGKLMHPALHEGVDLVADPEASRKLAERIHRIVTAPRYHSGGRPGLKDNEVAAPLINRGEEIRVDDEPNTQEDPNFFVREIYRRNKNGEVTLERKGDLETPQWVLDYEMQHATSAVIGPHLTKTQFLAIVSEFAPKYGFTKGRAVYKGQRYSVYTIINDKGNDDDVVSG